MKIVRSRIGGKRLAARQVRRAALMGCTALVGLSFSATAEAQNVAIVKGSFYTTFLRDQLVASGVQVTEITTYTAADLAAYNAVITYGNTFNDYNALFSYATAGGRVILTPWQGVNYTVPATMEVFVNGGSAQFNQTYPGITVITAASPLLAGVTFPAAGGFQIGRVGNIGFYADPAVVQVANYSDGTAYAGTRAVGAGVVIAINEHVITSDSNSQSIQQPFATRIFLNAVGFVSTRCAPATTAGNDICVVDGTTLPATGVSENGMAGDDRLRLTGNTNFTFNASRIGGEFVNFEHLDFNVAAGVTATMTGTNPLANNAATTPASAAGTLVLGGGTLAIANGAVQNAQTTLQDAGTSLTVAQGGTVSVTTGTAVLGTGATQTVSNQGTIIGTGGARSVGVALDGGGTITNGSATNATATIRGGSTGIDNNTTAASTINNYGVIRGDTFQGIDQVTSGTSGALTVNNFGTGVIYGAGTGPASGYGIAAKGVLTLDNQGRIVGGNFGVASEATANVTNSGTIAVGSITGATVTAGTSAAAIGVRLDTGGTVTNAYNGTIAGGSAGTAVTSGGALTVNNYGTLATGGGTSIRVTGGTGAANISLFAGSTAGAVALGGGNDTVTLYNGTGTANGATGSGNTILQAAGTNAAAVHGVIDLAGGTNVLTLAGVGNDTGANGVSGALDVSTVTGATTIQKVDSGTWALTGNGANSGTTLVSVNGGLLTLAGGDVVPDAAGLQVNGGVTSLLSNETIGYLTGNGGTVQLNANTLTLGGAQGESYNGTIAGTGNLIKRGAADQSLGGINSFTGTTTIEAGRLTLTNAGALAQSSSVALTGATAILDIETSGFGATTTINNLSGVAGSQVVLGGKGVTSVNQTTDAVFAGTLTSMPTFFGTGELIKDGAATLTLTGTNAVTTADIAAGTLALANAGSLNNTNLNVNGTFDVSAVAGGTTSIGSLSGGTIGTVALGATTLRLTNANDDDFDGSIGGTGGLAVDAGTETLTGTNTYTGATTIAANATLNLVDAGTLASSGVQADGTFSIAIHNGNATVNALTGGGAVQLGANTLVLANANGTFAGVIADDLANGNTATGGLTIAGGTQVLTGTNTYTGATTLAGGNLTLGAGGTSGSVAGPIAIGAGNTLTINRSDAVTLGQTISGAGNLTQAGTGTTTLAAANTYTGATTVNAGTLALGASNVIADTSPVTVAAGATLNLGTFSDTVASLGLNGTLDGSGTLTAATYTLNGAAVNANLGAGTLTNAGGTSTLTGTAGATTVNVNAGTLALGAANRLADTAAVNVATGAVLDLRTFNDTVGTAAIGGTLNGTGTLTAAIYTLNGAAVNANLGAGTLTNAGGVSTLTGTATATTVNVNAGTLALGAANRLADTAAVNVATGAVLDLRTFSDTVGTAAIGGTLNGSGTLTAATYTLNGAAVNGNLGAGTLTNAGGVSTLTGTAAAATVNVNAGTLALGAANRLADTAAVNVATGATLDLRTFSDTVGTAAISGTLNGTGTLTAATYTLNGAAVNGNLGAGTLTNAGGVSTLTGTAAAATVNVNAGTLRLGADERLLDTGAVTIASGATLDVNGRTETVATVNGAGTVALGAGRLVLAGAGASSLGALTGTGSVDKTGTGTLTLANAYASTGSINTSAGTTAFTGTSAGSLRVTGGTLTGTGTAAGGLTLTGGTVAPGTAANQFGTLTVGALTASGGTYAVDFGGAASGFASDLIRVNGAAALSGTVAVAPTSFTGNDRFQQTYTIVQANSLTGTFANGAAFGAVANDPTLFYRLRYDLVANAVVLQVQRQIDFTAAIPGGTANEIAVGRALNGSAGLASDAYAATLNAIAGSGGNRGATYDSLSGEAIADVTTGALFASDRFADLLRARIGLGRGGAAGAGAYALRAGMAGDTGHASGLAGRMQDGVDAAGGTAGADRGAGVWLQGYGAGRRLRGQPGQATTNSFVSGLAGGLDGRFGGLTVGIAGGVTDLDTRVQTRGSKVMGTLYQGGAYLGYDGGTLYGQVAGTYYGGDVTVRRQLALGGTAIGQAAGNTHVHGYTVSGVLGARFEVGGGTRAGIELMGQQTQAVRRAYTETAPLGLGLTAARDSRDVFTGTAQVKLSHLFTGNGWTAEPYASGGAQLNTGDLATVNAMQFGAAPTGTGGFLVQGARLERTLGVFTGGVEIRPSDSFRIDLAAGASMGKRTREGQIKVSARIGF